MGLTLNTKSSARTPAARRHDMRHGLLIGLVFALPAAGPLPARAQPTANELVLHSFKGPSRGAEPSGPLIRDFAGNLYGTTRYGGASGKGVVYRVDPAGHQTVLHSFTGAADGGFPEGGVIRDAAGNLYGTTSQGGITTTPDCLNIGCGVVYRLNAAGQQTVLYRFTGGLDGAEPVAGVIRDAGGNLYGTTPFGGSGRRGSVY